MGPVISGAAATAVSATLLVVALTFARTQPRGLPEAVVTVPSALLAVGLGLVTPAAAWAEVRELAPTVGFLAAILVLAHLADTDGVFRWLGDRLASASRGRPRRLLGWVFGAAAVTTAILSLDATVVLLTPVVLFTATRLRARPRPHVYACAHLANSASTVLPVSNLTNLLAFDASGLSFLGFAGLMTLPWLTAIGVEYLVFRWFFRRELTAVGPPPDVDRPREPTPRYSLAVLAVTLAGFGVSGPAGVEPAWVAVAGAAALAVPALARRRATPALLVRAASPLFCLFVLALGVVVAAVTAHGLGSALAALLPRQETAPGLIALLVVAGMAALLANLVNNLPATLAMVTVLGAGAHPGLVLAMLLGVNIGPNLSYTGSLATLLWRRVLAGGPAAARPGEFSRLGALAVPVTLVAAALALWLGLQVGPLGGDLG
jgi:arsenical pump membrane protein